jgi:predicted RNase H-like HicB family nuclease
MAAGGFTMRQVFLYPDEGGWWVVECPSLPGCVSQGKTKQEALTNIREAIDLYIEVLQDRNEPIPEDAFGALLVAV